MFDVLEILAPADLLEEKLALTEDDFDLSLEEATAEGICLYFDDLEGFE